MEPRRFVVSVPAQACSLKPLRAFVEAVLRPACGVLAERIVLAVDEACSNVIKYRARAIEHGAIEVDLEIGAEGVRVRVGRFCRLADVGRIKPRNLADVRPGGLGTALIDSVMDRVSFEPEPDHAGCMALVMERRFEQGG